jgi:outer membrane protein TolC
VLNAVREVDTATDAYAAQQDRLRHLADAVAAAKLAATLATERFDRGLIDSLNVIDAKRQGIPD